jgi:hypothetical protein
MNPSRHPEPSLHNYRNAPPVTIRWASTSDRERLEILAELDEAAVPAPPLLLAFVGEELWAARSLSAGVDVSDPFRPSAEVVELLAERGRQLTVPERRSRLRLPGLGGREARLAAWARPRQEAS